MTHTPTDADVRYSHLVDDTEKMRTGARNELMDQRSLLDDALHALDRGRYDVVREFLSRSLDHGDRAIAKLAPRDL